MINLLYCANAGIFDGVLLSLMSAADKTSSPVTAYILTMDLTDLNTAYKPFTKEHGHIIEEVIRKKNADNRAIVLDATKEFKRRLGNSPNLTTGYTPYTLLRLLAVEFPLPDQILYVDADTMFNGDIRQIEAYDITDYELAGAVDYLGRYFIAKDYLNAGVLYLNMKKIKETKLFDRALTLCLTKEMVFPDQDAINELVELKLILPRRFNEQHKWSPDTIIQHFAKTIYVFPYFKVVNIKQWQIELVQNTLKLHVYDAIYQQYRKIRNSLKTELLEPVCTYKPFTIWQQIKINIAEVKGYLALNGGIFRQEQGGES
ncbi:MAG: glycosyltransferase family 8 protein [Lachnospiraceae bacterium]|nr:glycosyltransferase family 8 protein [Lachnospiraceae bacterium]